MIAGRYRLDDLVGKGGMASVYRGFDVVLGREVAIKILAAELAEDEAFRTRFRLEAQAASRMAHPAIVRVFDAGETEVVEPDGRVRPLPYIVMEFVDGVLLKDIIAAGPIDLADVVTYADGILEALQYSHLAGIVHRDIKPGNVMVTPSGQVKVMDFGIARALSDSSSTVAETTQILGTAAYFSPEQARGESVDARTDLYSTGVVIYELLTGRPPFRGDSPVAVAYQHVSETPEPPSDLREDLPPGWDDLVLRALAKNPFERYPDAASFRAALQAIGDPDAGGLSEAEPVLPGIIGGNDARDAVETEKSLRRLARANDCPSQSSTRISPVWIWTGLGAITIVLIGLLVGVFAVRSSVDTSGSGGPKAIADVTQMTFSRASAQLSAEGFTVMQRSENSSSVASGIVIRTDPQPGTIAATGSTVVVYVSIGPKSSTVPTLTGLNENAAAAALTAAGLGLGSVTQSDDPSTAAGIVLSASATAGTQLPPGTLVNLVVASGSVNLPDLTGFTVTAAQRQLQALALTVVLSQNSACPATSPATVEVMSASPGEVPIHSTITLTVCSGTSSPTPNPGGPGH